jgi:hypothetical protein
MQLLCALLLFSPQASAFPQKPVSLSLQAMPASVAVEQMSQTLGLRLSVSPAVARDVITVRVSEAPTDEVLERVAAVLNGTWRSESQGWRLIRTPQQEEEDRRATVAFDAKWILEAQGRLKRELDARPPFNAERAEFIANQLALLFRTDPDAWDRGQSARFQQLYREQPMSSAAAAIALEMSPEELAQVEPGVMTVYAAQPNRSQRRMSPRMLELAKSAVEHRALWREAVARRVPAHLQDEPEGAGPAAAAYLVVFRDGEHDTGINFSFVLVDGKGIELESGVTILRNQASETAGSKLRTGPKQEGADAVAPEGVGKELLAFRNPATISEEGFKTLLDPVAHEPLSLLASPGLHRIAELRNVQMVAHLSDEAILGGFVFDTNPTSPDLFLERLDLLGIGNSTREGWLMLRPHSPVVARSRRSDRQVLRNHLRLLRSGADPTLEQQAIAELRLPQSLLRGILEVCVGQPTFSIDTQTRVLRFLGTLSDAQAQTARERGLPVDRLSPEGRQTLIQLLHHSEYELYLDLREGFETSPVSGTVYRWPSFTMPNRLPGGGMVRITDTVVPAVLLDEQRLPDGSYWERAALSAQELALTLVGPRGGGRGGTGESGVGEQLMPRRSYERMRLGHDRRMKIEVDVTREIVARYSLRSARADSDARFGPGTLPEAFKAQVEAEIRRLRAAGGG